jgi:hypothetical protein
MYNSYGLYINGAWRLRGEDGTTGFGTQRLQVQISPLQPHREEIKLRQS